MEIIKDKLYYVGVMDPKLRVFDIVLETPYGTSYNSYMLIGEKYTAVIETAKEKFTKEFLKNVEDVLKKHNRTKVDYVIHNHTEPDHTGSSKSLLEKYPEATVIGSENAITYLKKIWNFEEGKIKTKMVPGDLKSLNLGGMKLDFYNAPFLHWPDSMFTFVPSIKTLFTCDFLGSHYCFPEMIDEKISEQKEKDYKESLTFYFDVIFSPFKKYVQDGLNIIKKLQKETGIDMIGASHGPILKKLIKWTMDRYDELSDITKPKFEEKITIFYVSAYGFTGEVASEIKKGIEGQNIPCEAIDLVTNKLSESEMLAKIRSSKGLLFGTPTILKDALPNVMGLLGFPYINPIISNGQYAGTFGSYGWSGEGTDNIDERLLQLKLKTPLDPLKVRFRPSSNDFNECREFGDKFARAVKGEDIKRKKKNVQWGEKKQKTYDLGGKKGLWKCIVCGELVIAKVPPNECPACLVDGDVWVLVRIIDDEEKKSDYEGTIVIVGGSAAGVSAAKTIRQNSTDKVKILLFSDEGLPYYRPSITKVKANYFQNEEYYKENKIELIPRHIDKIDYEKKVVLDDQKKEYKFDKLIICTGSRAMNPFKVEAPNVFTIYSKEDIQNFLKKVEDVKKVKGRKAKILIIGAGALGLEMTEVLADKQKDNVEKIVLCDIMDSILPRFFNQKSSNIFEKLITEETGAEFKFKHFIDHFEFGENKEVSKCLFTEKSETKELECDVVLVTVGQQQNIELGEQIGLEMNKGHIKVNPKMETSKKDVYAAGNVAQIGPYTIGNFSNATKKGEVAGYNCIGMKAEFGLQFGPYSLVVAGKNAISTGKRSCNYIENCEKSKNEYTRLDFNETGSLVGVVKISKVVKHVEINKALSEKMEKKESVIHFLM